MHIRNAFIGIMASLILQGACVIGDDGAEVSPYDTAYFEVRGAGGVADGLSAVSVLVHGELGTTLTLSAKSAHFEGSLEAEVADKKTVVLGQGAGAGAGDGDGVAEVFLVSTTPGLATLSFKLAPVAASIDINFAPLRFSIDSPRAVAVRPGEVVHEVCARSNSARGALSLQVSAGEIVPQRVELDSSGEESGCGENTSEWPGSARLAWTSHSPSAELSLSFEGPGNTVLATLSTQLQGESFSGYDIVAREVEYGPTWTKIRVQLEYRETAYLPAQLAAQVALHDIRSVPQTLALLGSSSGNQGTVPQTDTTGWVSLFFENDNAVSSSSVFATPVGGGTLYLGQIEL